VVQEDERIQLSFDRSKAAEMCKLAIEALKAGLDVIDDDAYRRDLTSDGKDSWARCSAIAGNER
jgi:hypothetical protein